jgi:hypothetical protein
MKQQLIELIRKAFTELKSKEGYLFNCSIEENVGYDARKLHEVCLNHKLANYLEKFILPILQNGKEEFFVDIEFNREGLNKKELNKIVRPDIIIHNRKSGDEKYNFLVVECKKHDSSKDKIQKDGEKLIAFITNKKYEYQYGLQVIYEPDNIKGTIYYSNGNGIIREAINNS